MGALIGSIFGYKGHLHLAEGETVSQLDRSAGAEPIKLPFSIRLDRFILKLYPSGVPSEYRSKVRVIEGGRVTHQAEIRVNHPLTWRGVTFYQHSYGQSLSGAIGLRLSRRSDQRSFDLEVRRDRPELGVLAITHYQRLLTHLRPDRVHILVDGRIVDSGGPELAERLEREGYDAWRTAAGASPAPRQEATTP